MSASGRGGDGGFGRISNAIPCGAGRGRTGRAPRPHPRPAPVMYLGIDIGTSSVKTVLFDRDQRLIGQASRAADGHAPAPGLVRAGPRGLVAGASRRRSAPSPATTASPGLRGIGLSGQMHGAVCLDHDDQVLRPAILWNDGRAMAECAEIEAAFPRAREVAGNIAMPGFTAPKIAWLRKHEPQVYQHIDTVLLPKDYVRLRLTGHHVSEMSDAAGTSGSTSPRATGPTTSSRRPASPARHMPRLVEGSAALGRPPARARRALGHRRPGRRGRRRRRQRRGRLRRRRGAPGHAPSSRSAPRACSSSRTPASRRTPQGAVHAFCHAIPDTWHQMGVILSASDSLEWLARIAGRKPAELADAVGAVDRAVGRSPSCPTSPASAPRTTTRPPAAPSSGSRSRTTCAT